MERAFWQSTVADELAQSGDEVNKENRAAIRLFAIAGLPLGIAIILVQVALSTEIDLPVFIAGTCWVLIYFHALLLLEKHVIPEDYPHATLLLHLAEVPVIVCAVLLGTVWDPGHEAITFLIVLMAMPMFILDRPVRIVSLIALWSVLFLVVAFFVKPIDIFARDLLHTLVFFLASVTVTNIVIRIRIISLQRLKQAQHHLEHDELTGARNRRSLERNADNYVGKPLMVVIADLDMLDMLRDFYGHDFGNQVVSGFIDAMTKDFGFDNTYRYSGEKALCILSCENEQEGLAALHESRAQLKELIVDERHFPTTCAFGYVLGTPQTNEEFHQMIQLADVYANKAKKTGRGQTLGSEFDEEHLREGIIGINIDVNANTYETNQLTGLPSMSYFITTSEELLSSTVEFSRKPVIGYLNLLHIKRFNNEFGYAQGDELIEHAAQILREAFPQRLICSIAGSQFGVMCYEDEVGPGMQAANADLMNYKEGYPIECNAGFAACEPGDKVISLLDKAHVAQKVIKEKEGETFRFYDEELDADIRFNEYIVTHIDDAIGRGYLEVAYQPIIRTSTGEICSEEALSRWNGPECGLLLPGSFIPPLEESRQVYKLNLHVVQQVIKDFNRKKILGMPIVPVSVNLSRCDFEQCDMVQEITELMDVAGLPHDLLRIEITESAFVRNQELIKREVARFHENGFQVWMDDFGSEYSTLNLLQELDFDLIKLDMQFMRADSGSGKNLIIVSSIIDMARKMGISTLVEGVENEDHFATLRSMECDMMQGFYFSEPNSFEDVREKVLNEGNFPFEKRNESAEI